LENMKTTIIAVIVTAIICIAGTCTVMGGSNGGNSSSETLTITGSTTVQPLMVGFQEAFDDYSNININITGGGSGAGATAVMNGSADIGMMSRDLKSSESSLTATSIALDGVVIIIDVRAGVVDLSIEEIAGIYSGKYTNWNQLGGSDLTINPIVREEGSGTRDCLDGVLSTVDGFNTDNYSKYSAQSSTGSMIQQTMSVSGGIGYVNFGSMSSLDSTKVVPVSVDGVSATPENVKNGSYGISRNLNLVTLGSPSGAAEFLISWILSEQGQKIVESMGFVKVGA
jgi:phosphate transport system substrate-binding protein